MNYPKGTILRRPTDTAGVFIETVVGNEKMKYLSYWKPVGKAVYDPPKIEAGQTWIFSTDDAEDEYEILAVRNGYVVCVLCNSNSMPSVYMEENFRARWHLKE